MSVMDAQDFYQQYIDEDFERYYVPKQFEEVAKEYLILKNKKGLIEPAFFKIEILLR